MAIDPIPQPIRTLIELFSSALKDVHFPGVDASVFNELSHEVQAASTALQKAQQAVEEARQHLDETQKTLRKKAQHGLSYARIFADGDLELQKALAEISLLSDSKRNALKSARKGRNKTKKNEPAQDLLSTVVPTPQTAHKKPSAQQTSQQSSNANTDSEETASAQLQQKLKREIKKTKTTPLPTHEEPFLVQTLSLDADTMLECVDPPGADAGSEAA